MKSLLITSLVLLSFQFLLAQNDQTEKTGNLTVVITGFENNDGEVLLALADSRDNYESKSNPFIGLKIIIENRKAVFVIEDLPYGKYAAKVFHDENTNSELDTNFLGIPTEDYGFSNNVRGTFGPADYDDAKFLFEQTEMTMNISVD